MSRTAREYQKFIKDTSWYTHVNEKNQKELNYLILGLVGETGEFADKFKKIVRTIGLDDTVGFKELLAQGQYDKLLDELGDVAWYFFNLLNFFDISLEALLAQNTYKLFERINDRRYGDKQVEWPFTDPFFSYGEAAHRFADFYKEDEDGKL